MEGERAFTSNSKHCGGRKRWPTTTTESPSNTASEAATNLEWLGAVRPAGFHDTFRSRTQLRKDAAGKVPGNIAIAKFTHTVSQDERLDSTGNGAKDGTSTRNSSPSSRNPSRNFRPKSSGGTGRHLLSCRGKTTCPLTLPESRQQMAAIHGRRKSSGLGASFSEVVCQPTTAHDEKGLNALTSPADLAAIAAADPSFIHVKTSIFPTGREAGHHTAGIVLLGELLARAISNAQVTWRLWARR